MQSGLVFLASAVSATLLLENKSDWMVALIVALGVIALTAFVSALKYSPVRYAAHLRPALSPITVLGVAVNGVLLGLVALLA